MHLKKHLPYLFLFLGLMAHSSAMAEDTLSVKWKTTSGQEGISKGLIGSQPVEGRTLIFIAWELPENISGSSEEKIDGEWVTLPRLEKNGKRYVYLSQKSGQVRFGQGGPARTEANSETLDYEISGPGPQLTISKSCKDFNLVITKTNRKQSPIPAMIHCRKLNEKEGEIVFSTLQGGDWLGSGVFEIAGKGERWKAFYQKDINSLKTWRLSWGDPKSPDQALLTTQLSSQAAKSESMEKPFSFSVGPSYLSGTINYQDNSQALSGLTIPLNATYHQPKKWWYAQGGYDLFIYALDSSQGKSNSTARLFGLAGAYFEQNNWKFFLGGGYGQRNLNLEKVSFISSFDAPLASIETKYKVSPTKIWSLGLSYATTENQGSYSESQFYGAYLFEGFFNKETKIKLGWTSIKASSASSLIQGGWGDLSYLIQF